MMWWPLGGVGEGHIYSHVTSHMTPYAIPTGHMGLATPTNKRRDTTRWHKGGVGHTHFCLIIQRHVMHVTPLMTK